MHGRPIRRLHDPQPNRPLPFIGVAAAACRSSAIVPALAPAHLDLLERRSATRGLEGCAGSSDPTRHLVGNQQQPESGARPPFPRAFRADILPWTTRVVMALLAPFTASRPKSSRGRPDPSIRRLPDHHPRSTTRAGHLPIYQTCRGFCARNLPTNHKQGENPALLMGSSREQRITAREITSPTHGSRPWKSTIP